jgi:hypothetical protein
MPEVVVSPAPRCPPPAARASALSRALGRSRLDVEVVGGVAPPGSPPSPSSAAPPPPPAGLASRAACARLGQPPPQPSQHAWYDTNHRSPGRLAGRPF